MCVTLFQQRKRKLTCGTSNLPCPYSPSTPGCNLCQTQLLSPAWSTNIRHSLVLGGREQSGVGISWTESCFPSSFWQLTLGLDGCQGCKGIASPATRYGGDLTKSGNVHIGKSLPALGVPGKTSMRQSKHAKQSHSCVSPLQNTLPILHLTPSQAGG